MALSLSSISWLLLFLLYFQRYLRAFLSRVETNIEGSQYPLLHSLGVAQLLGNPALKRYRRYASMYRRQATALTSTTISRLWAELFASKGSHDEKEDEEPRVRAKPTWVKWGNRPFSEPPILDYSAFDEGGHLYKRLHRTKLERGSRLEESVKKDDFLIEIYLQKMYIGWVGHMQEIEREKIQDIEEAKKERRKDGLRADTQEQLAKNAEEERKLLEIQKRDHFLKSLEEDLMFEYTTVSDAQSDYCRHTSQVPRRQPPSTRLPKWKPKVIRHRGPVRPRPVWEPPCLPYSEFDEDGEVWKAIERRKKNSIDQVQATKTQDILTEHHLLVKYIDWTKTERDLEAYHGVEWREDFFDDLENELWVDQQAVLVECLADVEERKKTLGEMPGKNVEVRDEATITTFSKTNLGSINSAGRREMTNAAKAIYDFDGGEPPENENWETQPSHNTEPATALMYSKELLDQIRSGAIRATDPTVLEREEAERAAAAVEAFAKAETEAEAKRKERADRWQDYIRLNHNIDLDAASLRVRTGGYASQAVGPDDFEFESSEGEDLAESDEASNMNE